MTNQGKDEDRLLEKVGQIKENIKANVIQPALDITNLLEDVEEGLNWRKTILSSTSEDITLNLLPINSLEKKFERVDQKIAQGAPDILVAESLVASATSDISVFNTSDYITYAAEGGAVPFSPPDTTRLLRQNHLDQMLQKVTGNNYLVKKRKGAWNSYSMNDSVSREQACHSMREILTILLDKFAKDNDVKNASWWTQDPDVGSGKVSKRQKNKVFCLGGNYF